MPLVVTTEPAPREIRNRLSTPEVSQILSHPFRILGNGDAATVEQTSDQAVAEQIGVLILTRLGERALSPAFGITDPVFSTLDPSEVAAALETFGPDVTVIDIDTIWESDSTQLVRLDFE